MGLKAALVDQARFVRSQSTGATTAETPVYGDWFPARLTGPVASSSDPRRATATTKPDGALLYAAFDGSGEPIALSPLHQVEINSDELGASFWQVAEEPVPLRKKKKLLGYTVSLQRIQVAEVGTATTGGFALGDGEGFH